LIDAVDLLLRPTIGGSEIFEHANKTIADEMRSRQIKLAVEVFVWGQPPSAV
jgi:hypothetical protein